EALHGLHQANVTFLDQIAHGQSVAAIATGDVNDKSKVRQHQLPGSIQVPAEAEALSQVTLFFAAQDWNSANSVQVSIQASQGTGQREVAVAGDQCGTCGHELSSLGGHISTRHVRVLRGRKVPPTLVPPTLQFALSNNSLNSSSPSCIPLPRGR